MKDTYCEYCNPPYFEFKTETNGYTTSDITACINNNEELNINVFHTGNNSGTLIYDGSFNIPIKYCPYCGRRIER